MRGKTRLLWRVYRQRKNHFPELTGLCWASQNVWAPLKKEKALCLGLGILCSNRPCYCPQGHRLSGSKHRWNPVWLTPHALGITPISHLPLWFLSKQNFESFVFFIFHKKKAIISYLKKFIPVSHSSSPPKSTQTHDPCSLACYHSLDNALSAVGIWLRSWEYENIRMPEFKSKYGALGGSGDGSCSWVPANPSGRPGLSSWLLASA